MSFLQKLLSIFQSPTLPKDYAYYFTVKCHRCGEEIRGRVNLANDITIEYGERETITYHCRKVVMGEKQCFQRIEVDLVFDAKKNVLDRQISGGVFVD
jgi:hypothetical protein